MTKALAAAEGVRGSTRSLSDIAPAGMTEWKRKLINDAIVVYCPNVKAAKPMVAIRNLSPEFLELAIKLDVLLADYRDKYGRAWLLRRYCERRGVPTQQQDRLGRMSPVPELERIEKIAKKACDAIPAMIRTIE